MKRKQIVTNFYRQLAMLLSSGYSLIRALRILAERESNPGFAAALKRVIAAIEKGTTFWEALEMESRYFQTVQVQLIRIGESAGKLVIILNRLAEAGARELQINNRIFATLAYPMVILIAAILLIAFLTATIVPVFATLYQDIHAEIPGPTQFLLNVGWFFQNRWYILILLVVALFLLGRFLARLPRFLYFVHWLKLRYTVFGPMTKEYIVVSTCQTLGMLIEAGINMVRALELTRDATANRVVAEGLEEARREVDAGRGLELPLRKNQIFPPLVLDMIATGQEAGTLDQSLAHAAQTYSEELENKMRLLSSLIEPLLVIVIGGIVMFVVFSLFVPYLRLINVMSMD